MKTFFLLAAAAALVSGQTGQQNANPTPFNRGTISAYNGVNRGGNPNFGTHPIPLVRLREDRTGNPLGRWDSGDGQTPIGGLVVPFTQVGGIAPNARQVSNIIVGNSTSVRSTRKINSSLHTFFGQFTDHDLGLTDGLDTPFPIDVTGDPVFDNGTPQTQLGFFRAFHTNRTINVGGVDILQREPLNDITAWIDASQVYGEDDEKNSAIRGACANEDSGCRGQFLMVPQGAYGLLPTVQQINDSNGRVIQDVLVANPVLRVPDLQVRAGGDIRVEENNALESYHTIFVREHNRCAINLAEDESLTSDEIFEECRFFGMAYMQNILYTEYAPRLMSSPFLGKIGHNLDATYLGYNSSVAPDVLAEFSMALFRLGHSELPTEIVRADPETLDLLDPLDLSEAFVNPLNTPEPISIDQILAGLWQDQQNEVDPFIVEDVRNQLFQNPADNVAPNDLIAFNHQRSRDCGLPTLNELRSFIGLTPWTSFTELVGTQALAPQIAANLAIVYTDVNNVELFIGGISESPYRDGNLGETLSWVVSEQYQRFRVADNYYFENGWFSDDETNTIRNTALSTLILRNTQVSQMPCEAMRFSATGDLMMCQNMFNSASSITFGAFTVFATLAAFFF